MFTGMICLKMIDEPTVPAAGTVSKSKQALELPIHLGRIQISLSTCRSCGGNNDAQK